ncbi:MAG TPA: 1-deoxy-D-xylulose-5-phosphate reductoisomerase [Armatimonadota bacterium]|jgi:1-deoxy-D-xylulose-5-phosphate reductoisomerase
MAPKTVVILGSTGSIGRQTLEIVAAHPDRLRVVGLAAGRNMTGLAQQAAEYDVTHLALADEQAAESLAAPGRRVYAGDDGLGELVREAKADVVVAALSGGAGLSSILAALQVGSHVALANKEPLVTAGHLVTEAARRHGAVLLPVDSEISAVWQCLRGEQRSEVEKVLLTASGGPFANATAEELAAVTPEQALAHPTWRMGPKVTVDSATLMNKGFEIFELKWMFDLDFAQIEVIVHHQSVIHSAVQFCDGSTLAQMGRPDMRVPIQFALSYPERWAGPTPRLDLPETGSLTFGRPNVDRFPCLRLAREAGQAGGSYPAALSAADEVAVAAFLAGELGFTEIARVIDRTLQAHQARPVSTIYEVQRAEEEARELARKFVVESRRPGV